LSGKRFYIRRVINNQWIEGIGTWTLSLDWEPSYNYLAYPDIPWYGWWWGLKEWYDYWYIDFVDYSSFTDKLQTQNFQFNQQWKIKIQNWIDQNDPNYWFALVFANNRIKIWSRENVNLEYQPKLILNYEYETDAVSNLAYRLVHPGNSGQAGLSLASTEIIPETITIETWWEITWFVATAETWFEITSWETTEITRQEAKEILKSNWFKENKEWEMIGHRSLNFQKLNWEVPIETIIQSTDEIENNAVELKLPEWINIQTINWEDFTWILQVPEIVDETKITIAWQNIISAIKIWEDNQNLFLKDGNWNDLYATIQIPTPDLNIWDNIVVNYSSDWTTWSRLTNIAITWIAWDTYAVFQTNHFTTFALWQWTWTFTINADAIMATWITVTLNMNISWALQMKFGNTPEERDWTWWRNYATTLSWNLTWSTDGIKTVYAMFKNSETWYVTDKIILSILSWRMNWTWLAWYINWTANWTTFYDKSANKWNATWYNTSTWVINGEQYMNLANSGYVVRSNNKWVPAVFPFSISAWVKLDTIIPKNIRTIVSLATGTNYNYGLIVSWNKFWIIGQATTERLAYWTLVVETWVWYHVVWTWSATAIRTLFVNGTIQVTGASNAANSALNKRFSIWRTNFNAPSRYFTWLVDEVRVYSGVSLAQNWTPLRMGLYTPDVEAEQLTTFNTRPNLYGMILNNNGATISVTLSWKTNDFKATYTPTKDWNFWWVLSWDSLVSTGLLTWTYDEIIVVTNEYGKVYTSTFNNNTLVIRDLPTIDYSPAWPAWTNQVIATLTWANWRLQVTNNSWNGYSKTYTFTESGSFNFEYRDNNRNTWSTLATVYWIDTIVPTVSTWYISSGATWMNWTLLYYNWIIDIRAEVSDDWWSLLSWATCQYTTWWITWSNAVYQTTYCEVTWLNYTSDINVRFRISDNAWSTTTWATWTYYIDNYAPPLIWGWLRVKKWWWVDADSTNSVTVDELWNVYLGWWFGSSLTFWSFSLTSAVGSDSFAAKISSTWVWMRASATAANGWSNGKGIDIDSEWNSYLGWFFGNASMTLGSIVLGNSWWNDQYIAQLSSTWAWVWARKAWGGWWAVNNEVVDDVATDASWNVYIVWYYYETGYWWATELHGSGSRDIVVAKLSSTWAWMWAVKAWWPGQDRVWIKISDSWKIYLAWTFQNTSCFSNICLTSSGGDDMYVAQLSSTWVWMWAVKAWWPGADALNWIDVDNSWNIYAIWYFQNPTSFGPYSLWTTSYTQSFVAKLSSTWIWQRATSWWAVLDYDYVDDIAIDSSWNIYVAWAYNDGAATFGNITLSPVWGYDIFLAKISSTWVWQGAIRAWWELTDEALSMDANTKGDIYMWGRFQSSSIEFGDTQLSSSWDYDPFVAKIVKEQFTINNYANTTDTTSVVLNIICPTEGTWQVEWIEMAYGNNPNPTNWTWCTSSQERTLDEWIWTKTVYMRFRDALGNITDDVTDTILFEIIDNTPPTIPELISPTSWQIFGTWTVNLLRSWAVDTWAWIDGYVYEVSTWNDFATILNSWTTPITWITITWLETNIYYRRVYAFDGNGNTWAWSSWSNFLVDTILPTIWTAEIYSGTTGNNWATLYYKWTIDIWATVYDAGWISWTTCEYTTWWEWLAASYSWAGWFCYATWLDPQGDITINFRAKDLTDNLWTWTSSTYNYDNTAPLRFGWSWIWVTRNRTTKWWWTNWDELKWIAVDASWNSYVAWYFQWTWTFGSTTLKSSWSNDIFIWKLSNTWVWLRAVQWWWSDDDQLNWITVDSGWNSYVVWYFQWTWTFGSTTLKSSWSNDIFIWKLSSTWIWIRATKIWTTLSDQWNWISIDSGWNSYVVRYNTFAWQTVTYVQALSNTWASLRTTQWAWWMPGDNNVYWNWISIDSGWNTYIVWYFIWEVSFGWNTLMTSYSDNDIFVSKVSNTWVWLRAVQWWWSDDDKWNWITVDSGWNSYVVWYFNWTWIFGSITLVSTWLSDIFIWKLSSTWVWEQVTQWWWNSIDQWNWISIDSGWNSYVVWIFNETATFGSITLVSTWLSDIFFWKLSSTWAWEQVTQWWWNNFDIWRWIAIDASWNSYVVWGFNWTWIFGSITLNATGDRPDVFIWKVGLNNTPSWSWFTINNDTGTTTTTLVTLDIICPSDQWIWWVQMSYGNSPNPTNWTWCTWSIEHTLENWNWIKTVYMAFRDAFWNITGDFTDTIILDIPDDTPPTTPELISPTSWQYLNTWNINLLRSWSFDTWWMSWYVYELSTWSDFSVIYTWWTVLTTWATIMWLEENIYYRRIYAFDIAWNTWTWTWMNFFLDFIPPTTSQLISPTSWQYLNTWNINLLRSWSFDTWWMSWYVYELSTWSDFSVIYTWWTVLTTWATIIWLEENRYYRRIYAFDIAGNTWTWIWMNFDISFDNIPPTIPELISPTSWQIFTTTWTVSLVRSAAIDTWVGVEWYVREISTWSDFAVIFNSGTESTTWKTITWLTNNTYYRRVYAYDEEWNTWNRSEIWNFVINITPPSETLAPVLIFTWATPANLSTITWNNFSWSIHITETWAWLDQFIRNRNWTPYSIYDSGLILMMNFDKISALWESDWNILDFSQYWNNGSWYEWVTWTSNGKRNWAYEFDWTDDYLKMWDIDSLDNKSQITFAWWIRKNRNWTAETIFSRGSPHNSYGILLYTDWDFLIFRFYNSPTPASDYGQFSIPYSDLTIETRKHLLISVDLSTERADFYIDGVNISDSKYEAGAGMPSSIWTSSDEWALGARANWGSPFSGTMDEIRLYSRAFSSWEIQQLYYTNLSKFNTWEWLFNVNYQCLRSDTQTISYSWYASDLATNTATTWRSTTVSLPNYSWPWPLGIDIGSISASLSSSTLSWQFTWYFKFIDRIWTTWWTTTIQLPLAMSWVNNPNNAINWSNIYFKWSWIDTINGISTTWVYINSWLSGYISFSGAQTYIQRDYNSYMCPWWEYGNKPYIKVEVPAFQSPDTYSGSITYDKAT